MRRRRSKQTAEDLTAPAYEPRAPAPAEPEFKLTPGGSPIYEDEITDTRGKRVSLIQSSIADAPAVWIFTSGSYNGEEVPPGYQVPACLDAEGARRVRDALDAFIKGASTIEE